MTGQAPMNGNDTSVLDQQQWISRFLGEQLYTLQCALNAANAQEELPDQCKLDRQLLAITRCVAACDAYHGDWLNYVRWLAVDEYALPPEEVGKAILSGTQQAILAREWRATREPLAPKKTLSAYRLPESTVQALEYTLQQRSEALLAEFLRTRSPIELAAITEHIDRKLPNEPQG